MDDLPTITGTGFRRTSLWLTSVLLVAILLPLPVRAAEASGGTSNPPEMGSSVDDFHSADPQLRSLMGTMLAENPAIIQAWARYRASLQRVPQARSLPDPQLSYRYFARSPETRVGPQEHALDLNQAIPWAGKRRLQAERAEEFAGSMAWRVRDLQNRLMAELKTNYFNAGYIQEALAINAEEMDLLGRFEEIALTRYATGEGIQQSVIKVQTDMTRLADRELSLRKQLDILARRVAELLGRPETVIILEPIELPLLDVQYDMGRLEESALANHPRVQEVQRLLQADAKWTRRQELESRPDFRFGVSYVDVGRRQDDAGLLNPPEENGKNILSLLVSFNLPIYRKRIKAGIAEARESTMSNQQALASVQDQLLYLVQEAVLRLDSTDQQGRLYRDVLIPQAHESLASAEAAYTTNKQNFLDLLDAERILFQVRLTFNRLLADSWIALADIEEATGRAFPESVSPGGMPGRHEDRS